MRKMKSVLAAAAALSALSCTAVCAFAESDSNLVSENSDVSVQDTEGEESKTTSGQLAKDAADAENPNSGVEGVAAVAGVAMIAGAALVISHKHEK